MATLADLCAERTDLTADEVGQLAALVAEWSIMADLSFGDLVLWVPTWNGGGFIAVAQVRPSTGPTRIAQDLVGQFIPRGRNPILERVVASRRSELHRSELRPLVALGDEAFPIIRNSRVVAVIQRQSSLESRTEGMLERNYLEAFDALAEMATLGLFPQGEGVGHSTTSPRVGDGFLRLDPEGMVVFASPNAISACHRLGLVFGIAGQHLANTLMRLTRRPGPANETLMLLAGGRAAGETEVENEGAVMSLRSIPLVVGGQKFGAVVVLRDISEVRNRERSLLTKDASIREIHHRVKNNLQTVAALLRLQARRSDSDEVRGALEEAQRRIAAIATVHEILAHEPGTSVDFDEVVERLILMVRDMTRGMRQGTILKTGTFGIFRSEPATALAMVLTELIGNAVEHGISLRQTEGAVVVTVDDGDPMTVTVEDDGPGLPETGVEDGLGLSIVRTVVTQDLKGSLELINREGGGVIAKLVLPRPPGN